MDEIEEAFETRSGVEVAVSYGASQMLAQQIARGAPADMFISAGESPVEFLSGRGLLEPAVTNLLTNRLVLVVRPAVASDITSMDLLNAPVVERVAIADPELAPAGRYARDSLTRLGLWDGLQRKLVFGPDVRATLAYVESGNADAALVYATDARAGRNIEVLDVVPADSYPRIVYPVAVVRMEEQRAATIEFLDFLRSAAARAIFVKHGFEALH
jgi:molybdate transport system substrate-binding protein